MLYSSWLVDVNSHCQIREANFLTEFCYLLATEAGLDLRKKTLGPAGSCVFRFGRQTFSALLAGNFHLKFPQYKLSTPPSLQHKGKWRWKTIRKKPFMLHCFSFIIFHWPVVKKILIAGMKCSSCNISRVFPIKIQFNSRFYIRPSFFKFSTPFIQHWHSFFNFNIRFLTLTFVL